MSTPRVGVIGGGQLARMMQPAAINLGIHLRVLSATPTDSAAQVIPDTVVGSHEDWEALKAFALECDVITFDHEHVPTEFLEELQNLGVAVRPGPHALRFAQDKIEMRTALTAAGIPCPKWKEIISESDLSEFGDLAGWPLILKTARGGYDGKGVWVVKSLAEATDVVKEIQAAGNQVLAEELVPFTRELAAQVARSPHGQCVAYPVVKSTQTDGICHEVIAPCPDLDPERAAKAQAMAIKIADLLDVHGMLAVELFDTGSEILVNELAMRPHNSGHFSIDAAITSQFEQHLRAVLDLPLGETSSTSKFAVMINLLGVDSENDFVRHYPKAMAMFPQIKFHMYEKAPRQGRKMGHLTCTAATLGQARDVARQAAQCLGLAPW